MLVQVLRKLKGLVHRLQCTDELKKTLKQALKESDIISDGELENDKWEEAWTALKSVWASKWNDRAFYSCKKAGIGAHHVQVYYALNSRRIWVWWQQ